MSDRDLIALLIVGALTTVAYLAYLTNVGAIGVTVVASALWLMYLIGKQPPKT